MQIDDMVLVSIDDHVIEPVNMFDNHMPEKYKDQAPRYVNDPATGRGYWEFQGQETGLSGLGAVASWPREEWDMNPVDFAEMRPATYDVDLRVRDMDANGQLTGMCFPTFAGFNGMSLARSTVDRDLTNVVVSAYNDWHIDELAGEHPGRFIPLAIVPTYDPQSMVAEIHRVAKKGCTAVSLPETPYGVGLPAFDEDGYWDPVFQALCDHDMAMCLHIGGAFGLLKRANTASEDNLIIMSPQLSAVATSDLMAGGVFIRFPSLKVAMSEGGIGWIPFFLDRMDRHVWNHRWTGLKVANGKTPTELWRSNFLGCFITDPSGAPAARPDGHRDGCLGMRLSALRLDVAPVPRVAAPGARRRRLRRRRDRGHQLEERLPVLQLRPFRGHPEGKGHGRGVAGQGDRCGCQRGLQTRVPAPLGRGSPGRMTPGLWAETWPSRPQH